jgi:C-terminal processing protease CtpA/Prc
MYTAENCPTLKERRLEIGKLWAIVGLFHPRLMDDNAGWFGAFARASERAASSATPLEHWQNVQNMLEELGDPNTCVLPPADFQLEPCEKTIDAHGTTSPMGSTESAGMTEMIGRSVTIEGNFIADDSSLAVVKDQLNALTAERIIVDLRGYVKNVADRADPLDVLLRDCFCSSELQVPVRRSKFYSGYPSDISGWDYFYSGWCTSSSAKFGRSANPSSVKPCFLIDHLSFVSPLLLAMQDAGLATIVSLGPSFVDSHFRASTINGGGDLRVSLRLESYYFASGKEHFNPDKVFDVGTFEHDEKLFEAISIWLEESERSSNTASLNSPKRSSRGQSESEPNSNAKSVQRLAGLFRIWVIIRYFFPYHDLTDIDWDSAVDAAYEDFAAAVDSRAYNSAVAKLTSCLNDSHVSVRSATSQLLDPAAPPLLCRIIESRPTVVQVLNTDTQFPDIGSCIVAIDGQPVQTRIDFLTQFCSASSPQSLNEIVCERLLAGEHSSEISLTVEGKNGRLETLSLQRDWKYRLAPSKPSTVMNAPFEKLNNRLGYVDLTQLRPDMIDQMFDAMQDTDGLIFDMRGYPLGTFEVASRLAKKSTPAVRFIRPLVRYPHQIHYIYDQSDPTLEVSYQHVHPSAEKKYPGKTVMLIDGRTISQAEKMAMFFKAANGTALIGEPSAGANGTVTDLSVADDLIISFSGDAISFPDGRQTQRCGLQPDVLAPATIDSIRSRVDNALAAAINYLSQS